jgi:putative phage-type endonuclease
MPVKNNNECIMTMMDVESVLTILFRSLDAKTIDDGICDEELIRLVSNFTINTSKDVDGSIEKRVKELRRDRAQLKKLMDTPQVEQRSEEWHRMRRDRLTASDLAQSMNRGKFGTRNQLLKKKAEAMYPEIAAAANATFEANMHSMRPLVWGTMFEPMVSRCYSECNHGVEIYEFGLVPHPELECFGASPDGITETGVMVEFKCPWKRKIDGHVPEQYSLQVQGQLSTCQLTHCDYFECQMIAFEYPEEYYANVPEDATQFHGVLLEFKRAMGGDTKKSSWYEYSPAGLTPRQAYQWAQKTGAQILKTDKENIDLVQMMPWKMGDKNQVRLSFEPEKWKTVYEPQIRLFWKDVCGARERLRQDNCKPLGRETTLDLVDKTTTPSKKRQQRQQRQQQPPQEEEYYYSSDDEDCK